MTKAELFKAENLVLVETYTHEQGDRERWFTNEYDSTIYQSDLESEGVLTWRYRVKVSFADLVYLLNVSNGMREEERCIYHRLDLEGKLYPHLLNFPKSREALEPFADEDGYLPCHCIETFQKWSFESREFHARARQAIFQAEQKKERLP